MRYGHILYQVVVVLTLTLVKKSRVRGHTNMLEP